MSAIKSVSRNKTLWPEFEIADTPFKRFRGIMFCKKIEMPLVFVLPSESKTRATIHSFFCLMPFDAVFLDAEKRVVDVKEDITPWRPWIAPERPAKYIIECAAGEAARLKIFGGEQLEF